MYGPAKYNLAVVQPTPEASTLHGNAIVTQAGAMSRLDPDNPVLWLVGIGAVTLGLIAFSTHVRVGPFTADVGGGK